MANHRAERNGPSRDDSAERSRVSEVPTVTGGKRRAPKPTRAPRVSTTEAALRSHAGGRKNIFPGLPSAPALAGVAALVIAAAGAVTVAQPSELAATHLTKLSTQASVLTGVSGISSSNASSKREQAVSRDSEREALQDAASQQLQAAAEAQAKERNAALAALAASAEKHANQIALNAWQLPIPAGVYHLTAGFGDVSGLWSHTHTGLDFAAPTGTPIRAVANGVVTDVGYSGAYGNRTIETLEDGTELWYCHQNAFAVGVGDTISSGQLLGYVGSTGNVTGPHLHLEVRPGAGDPVDPFTALTVHGLHP